MMQDLIAMYGFAYISWLQLAAEYGGSNQNNKVLFFLGYSDKEQGQSNGNRMMQQAKWWSPLHENILIIIDLRGTERWVCVLHAKSLKQEAIDVKVQESFELFGSSWKN